MQHAEIAAASVVPWGDAEALGTTLSFETPIRR